MTIRRGGRPSQVRPRPPSSGRPAPASVRPRPTAAGRVATHRRVERSRGLPLAARLLLVVAVAALGAVVLYTATGGLAKTVASMGSTLGGFMDNITATPSPSPTIVEVADAPRIEAPQEPYTNQPTVDLVVAVPNNVVGDDSARIRLYLALPDQASAPIQEVSIGPTPRVVIAGVALTKGTNNFSATIVRGGTESEPSPIVAFVLDQAKPKITLISPKNGATVNRDAVTLKGSTQARSTLVAHDQANNATITGQAAADGTFSLSLPIEAGLNPITIKATDPAGNASQIALGVRRGSGKLSASLTAGTYRLSASKLPTNLQLTVVVTDPDGAPLAGAQVTFTLSIPGIPTVTQDAVTDADGKASFKTSVPKGATVGTGPATALVVTEAFGSTSDRTVITVVR